jgi:hypothetical protein
VWDLRQPVNIGAAAGYTPRQKPRFLPAQTKLMSENGWPIWAAGRFSSK